MYIYYAKQINILYLFVANNKSHFQKVSFTVHYPSDTNLRIKISLIGLWRRFQQLKLEKKKEKEMVKTICNTV